ncbi:unnamed protein product [Paramecium sonneborni]|uniref:Mitochondrial carrier protein n=1 Tax=Paramecium sonneborni TaxID=65129 RepID=A0A8S1NHD0_9CILI|nr:unnamed protein product [Paramecium sonneborni]
MTQDTNKSGNTNPNQTFNFKEVANKALRSGLSGSMAMAIQVCSLMWLRTTMNYQYRYGGTIIGTIKHLYGQGGVLRFYKGLAPALLQGPLSRFGDTFANTLFLTLMDSFESTRKLPVMIRAAGGSVMAGIFRIALTPIDTVKTILQVEGKNGLTILQSKIKAKGVPVLYHGALATASATIVGHYPWFATFNLLNEKLPDYTDKKKKLARRAFIGFCSSVISDTISNSLRVIKTTKQTSQNPITYQEAVNLVLEKDGVKGLFGRGLKTRILTNGLQGLLFSILWKGFEDYLNKRSSQQ